METSFFLTEGHGKTNSGWLKNQFTRKGGAVGWTELAYMNTRCM